MDQRPDGRSADQLRTVTLEQGANPYAEGSCLTRFGGTLVLCTATVEDTPPPWRRGSGKGWVTAEYGMLPRSSGQRIPRERNGPRGRTQEIQRLIGRSLRAAVSGFDFGERTIRIDCDVLQADGGTRTAAITGGCVALYDACVWMAERYSVENPFLRLVAGVSVGLVDGQELLDLNYLEDSRAEVDANVVVADPDAYVEVQGTGEAGTFSKGQLDSLLELAQGGVSQLFQVQKETLGL